MCESGLSPSKCTAKKKIANQATVGLKRKPGKRSISISQAVSTGRVGVSAVLGTTANKELQEVMALRSCRNQ